MQTKSQIRQLLESAGIQPNKHFGQHFLIDLNLMRLLVDSAEIKKDDIVLEAGCGTGSLTSMLIQKAGRVIAVELDHNLFRIAREQLSEFENLDLLNTDILQNKHTLSEQVTHFLSLARKNFAGRLLLIANLPYNAATPVMMNLITGDLRADEMCVTVQKEVADRMKASQGGSDYGVLSILMQATGDVEIIRILKPSVFWPRPQVDSAMVKFVRNESKVKLISDIGKLAKVVHLFLNHRRKTLHACGRLEEATVLGIDNWDEIFKKCSVNSQLRPDQVSPEQFVSIASYTNNNK
ncbi:MAG: 16S rRNA (adenine(1518)-N(6)/adenine(1519)-N(6))-dimethyltransferase RsmA [Sedimentisphaerales bacterium]